MSHTKGPWKFHAQGDANEYCLVTDDNRWVIAFRQNGEMRDAEQEANARRIVACVNACAGVPSEVLNLVGAFGGFGRDQMVEHVTQQRDELNRQCREAMQELRNIADAKRFDRSCFAGDEEFASWAQNRARFMLRALEELAIAKSDPAGITGNEGGEL